jgi:uncharacterized protein (TIGR02996 family)
VQRLADATGLRGDILAAPNDTLSRKAYADWLEEGGWWGPDPRGHYATVRVDD